MSTQAEQEQKMVDWIIIGLWVFLALSLISWVVAFYKGNWELFLPFALIRAFFLYQTSPSGRMNRVF